VAKKGLYLYLYLYLYFVFILQSPRALRREVEEVKSFLRAPEACNLSKFLDSYGTSKLKRVDLCALFKKVITVQYIVLAIIYFLYF